MEGAVDLLLEEHIGGSNARGGEILLRRRWPRRSGQIGVAGGGSHSLRRRLMEK